MKEGDGGCQSFFFGNVSEEEHVVDKKEPMCHNDGTCRICGIFIGSTLWKSHSRWGNGE